MNLDEMRDDVRAAIELLPAWFTSRMMTDNWTFGLLTDTGITVSIATILGVHQAADGQLWIDVELSDARSIWEHPQLNILKAPTSRTQASIAVNHIVAAFELADT